MSNIRANAPVSIKGYDFDFELELNVIFGRNGDYLNPPEPDEIELAAVFLGDNKLCPNRYFNIYCFLEDWMADGGLDLDEAEREHALDMLLYWDDLDE